MAEKKFSPENAKKEFKHLSEDLEHNLPEIADLISRVAEKMEMATGRSYEDYHRFITKLDSDKTFADSPDVQQALGEAKDVIDLRRRNVYGADAWANPFQH